MRNLTQQEFDAYIASLPYSPNRFQLKVLQSIAFGSGNIMVSALAGSGKTTLLMQIAGLLLKMGVSPEAVLFIAFNTSIRDEMTERLPGRMSAINSHSLGNRALRKAIGKRTRPNGQKYRWIFQDTLGELSQHPQVLAALGGYTDEVRTLGKGVMYHTARRFASIVGKCQLAMIDLTDIEAIRGLAVHYGLDDTEGSMTDSRLEALYRLVAPLVEIGEEDARNTGRITFDEMLYLPLAWDLPLQKFPWVLGDECQDFNKTQQEILFRSLAPGGRMVLVGDIFQAIYGFTGADAHSFETLRERSGADVLPLNICYRCPAPVLDRARAIVPEIEVWDGHPGPDGPGVVEDIDVEQLYKHVQTGDMVLCRLNAPLISAYFDLIGNRVPARILGRDIAATLTKTLDKVARSPGFRYAEVVPKLREYERMMAAKYAKDDKYETQAQLLEDTVECLVVCATNFDNCTSVDCLKDELDKLFADDDDASRATSVTLCSVHKAKGLEADHVVIIAPDKMPMNHPKQKSWELQQEWNILYVAITRAKRKLTVCGRLSVGPVKFGDTPPPLDTDATETNDAPVVTISDKQALLADLDATADDHASDQSLSSLAHAYLEDEPSTASIEDSQEAQIVPEDVPAACPFCDGEGEVTHDGTLWVCEECDGTGNCPPEIDTPDDEPVRTLEPHEVQHHLRTLPDGKQPTAEAFDKARAFGIDLNDHPGKTFVLPHERTAGEHEAQPSLPGIRDFDEQLFSEPAPGNRPKQVELGIVDGKPNSEALARVAVDTALGTLDESRPGATLAAELEAFDEEVIDAMIRTLTHIKVLKAAKRQEQSA